METGIGKFDCIVVGAGIAGIAAANQMVAAGLSVCILEKSRGMGGRLATRRIESQSFDHGAQFFTAREQVFKKEVQDWVESGIARPWFGESGHERYCGVGGMNQMTKELAKGLDVKREHKVEWFGFGKGVWTVRSNLGTFEGSRLLLTNPAPQAVDLLEASKIASSVGFIDTLKSIEYEKCISLMLLLNSEMCLSEMGMIQDELGEPIATITETSVKGITDRPGIVIQSGPGFAEENFAASSEVIHRKLIDALPVEAALLPESASNPDRMPTQNLEALKAYLEAEEIIDRDIDSRMGEALELFQKAIELDSEFASAYVGLAETYRQRSISEFIELSREEINAEMETAVTRALELDDRLPRAHVIKGLLETASGDPGAAKASFRRAMEIKPEYPFALFGLAQLSVRTTRGREAFLAAAKEAVETMERVIKLDPKNPYYRAYVGSLLGSVDRRSEILEHYRMAAFQNPDSVDANNRLALHWTREYSRYDEAIVYLKKAHLLKPDVVEFAANIRDAYDTLGGFDEAAFWTEREMKLNREVAPMYKANLLRFQGKTSEAIEAYRENLALYEDGLSYEGGRLWTLYHDLRSGDLKEALSRYRRGVPELFEDDPQIRGGRMAQLALEAAALLQENSEDRIAQRLIERAESVYEGAGQSANRTFYLAIIRILKGDSQNALESFPNAVDQGLRNRIMLADARLDPLRNDPRFIESMEIVETDMAEQLANIRRMEVNGELTPLPQLPE